MFEYVINYPKNPRWITGQAYIKNMKWVGISGTWRVMNKNIKDKIEEIVREIMTAGDGVVSGGALGVDFIASEEALKNDPKAKRIKIFLPTTLEVYAAHYRKHAKMGTITNEQAEGLVGQLTGLKKINPTALIENPDINFTEETKKQMYYERNSAVIEASDGLVAFPVKLKQSESMGTEDTIEKAKTKGIPVKIFRYDLTKEE